MSKKVLVVDDEEDVRTFLETVLAKHGYDVITAANGVEGLKLAREAKPALITLDLMMPKQSGTDMYRNLQKNEELVKIPVIVISGLSGRHLAVPAPLAVFDKPIDPEAFIAVVRKAFGEND
jgi:DNA-binding response OmpR family regulator